MRMIETADLLKQAQRWLVSRPRGLPVAMFVLVLLLSLVAAVAIERNLAEQQRSQLQARATVIATTLERRGNVASAYLRAGAAALGLLDEMGPAIFRRFVSELRLDTEYLGSDGIGWIVPVRPGEEQDFDAFMAGIHPQAPRLHPRPDGSRPLALAVAYFYPDTERNRRVLGYDMAAEPVRREAIERAIEGGQPSASGKVILRQEGGGTDPGFIIFMPVFEGDAGERRLRGLIYSPFNGADFLAAALSPEELGEARLRLIDRESGVALASNVPENAVDWPMVRQEVQMAGRRFLTEVHLPPSAGLSGLALATLVFGVLVAILLLVVLRLLTRQAVRDEAALTWLQEQASIRDSLTRELNHRVKNTLASVLSIIALTRRRAATVEEFARGLDGRIRALSATHDLLTRGEWGATPLRAVVEAELVPYAHDDEQQVVLNGPDLELAPNDALSLGLAIHELATNAAKYGALSQPGGRVEVEWRRTGDTMVEVEWRESGGPPVSEPPRRGFGTDLIERIVARELKQPVRIEFLPEGVRCVLPVPVRRPSDFALRSRKPAPAVAG